MLLLELVEKTKKEEERIRYEYGVLKQFQEANPWIVNMVLEELQQEGKDNIPTFEDVIKFKEDMLLNDLSKVYRQIKNNNPNLIDKVESGIEVTVYFYSVKPSFYKKQLKKGFNLGEKDNMGYLVSGSNLIIEVATIDLKEFLDLYFTTYN
jgi:hypothetical protein